MLGSREMARAQLYRQLATLERSGYPIKKSLAQLTRGSRAHVLAPVLARLEEGEDLGAAFAAAQGISRLEAAVVAAGAAGGTLPQSFTQLAELLEERGAVKRRLSLSLAYPVLLLHLAIFLPSLPTLIMDRGGVGPYLAETLLPLLGLYALLGGGTAAWKAAARARPQAVDALQLSLPVVGGIARQGSLAVGLRALAVLYAGGVPLLRALQHAGQTCPNGQVGAAFERASERVAEGEDLAAAFALEGDLFGPQVLDLVETGSQSGHLDEMFERAAQLQDDQARQKTTFLVWGLGAAAFAAVALLVAYKVISFWSNLYSNLPF